jgi:hypothetical protein
MNPEIQELIDRVQQLKETVEPTNRDEAFKAMEDRLDRAEGLREQAEKERDAAIAEMEQVKADIGWTMRALRVRDLLFMRGEKAPASGEGWIPHLFTDPRDGERLEWINQHGRVGGSNDHWLISIPHHIDLETATLPTPHNIRDIIDVSIATAPKNELVPTIE